MPYHAIYHITHIENLHGIIHEGKIWSDAQRIVLDLPSTNIGYPHIKDRRIRHRVTVSAGGTLGNYVPFNFCPRSVMLFVLKQGHENYQGGQEPIVHIVSSIHSIIGTGKPWFFTDRHADLGYANQFDNLDHLSEIDWSVMPLRYWGGDSEIKEKRQAEFLVHEWCPWTAIEAIGVISAEALNQVQVILSRTPHKPRIEIHRDWYY